MNLEDDLRNCLCLNLRRGARLLTQAYDDALRPSGLKITQFQLLAAVDRFVSTPLNPLADFMGMDRTTLTRNLAVLERDGLVSVERGEEDRREHWVTMTPAGRAALERATPEWQTAQRAALDVLGRSEWQRLLVDLAKLGDGKS